MVISQEPSGAWMVKALERAEGPGGGFVAVESMAGVGGAWVLQPTARAQSAARSKLDFMALRKASPIMGASMVPTRESGNLENEADPDSHSVLDFTRVLI